ncbi:Zinc finger MYM-type protein 1, partial [Frankliniella fusca]
MGTLVVPATSASAERSFSLLRRLKTYLRTTMTAERLNHLAVLNCYQEEVDNLDVNNLIHLFVNSPYRAFVLGKHGISSLLKHVNSTSACTRPLSNDIVLVPKALKDNLVKRLAEKSARELSSIHTSVGEGMSNVVQAAIDIGTACPGARAADVMPETASRKVGHGINLKKLQKALHPANKPVCMYGTMLSSVLLHQKQ